MIFYTLEFQNYQWNDRHETFYFVSKYKRIMLFIMPLVFCFLSLFQLMITDKATVHVWNYVKISYQKSV